MTYLDDLRKEQKARDEAGSIFFFAGFIAVAIGYGLFLVLKGIGVNEDLSGGIGLLTGVVAFVGLFAVFAVVSAPKKDE